MHYLVKATATAERADQIDAKGGPAPVFQYIAQRFKPEAFYGNPTRRQVFLVVKLPTEADIAELMYVLGVDGRRRPGVYAHHVPQAVHPGDPERQEGPVDLD